jgi:AbrB family looped-hinge helix DNA binding protein
MERLTTSMDRHGRMLIPSYIRERLNIHPGEKVILEIEDNQIKIINADHVIDEMHKIFTKNQNISKDSHVDEFIKQKCEEYNTEELRKVKND